MIQAKSLIRRLVVPWLLAFGLVLGAAAQAVSGTSLLQSLSKDAGATDVVVNDFLAGKDLSILYNSSPPSAGTNVQALPAPVALQTRPAVFALANNYPNPFNPATTIQYALPQAADVELTVYNVLGQPVRTLVAEHQSAGRYVVEWDATNDSGHSLSSGMYFYRLQAGGAFREVKKMLLLR